MGHIPADYESNPENFGEAGGLRGDRCPEPLPLDLYEGLRIRLTKNVNKKEDYVNGMAAAVRSYNRKSGGVVVDTETGQTLCIYPITNDDVPQGRVTYYPLRPGYADTAQKFQGAELPHVTFWPDRPGCPAAATRPYRARAEHFVPAR